MNGMLTEIETKMIYEQSGEDEISKIHSELILNNELFVSSPSDFFEFAIVDFQKALPSTVSIACCQSCRHGNYCPYGNMDNEIFCLKDIVPKDKDEVCDIFDSLNRYSRCKKLLDFCMDFKSISEDEYYTYNDWEFHFK